MNSSVYVDLVLHILILFTFLTVFFFVKVSKMTETTLNNELASLVDENMKETLDNLSEEQKEVLKSAIKPLNLQSLMNYYKNPDLVMKVNNNWCLATSVIIIIGIFLLFLSSFVILRYVSGKDINILHLIGENVVVFTLIGVVEMLFFYNIGVKYIPVLPSKNIITVIETLKEKI
jgi:hypothetical protein